MCYWKALYLFLYHSELKSVWLSDWTERVSYTRMRLSENSTIAGFTKWTTEQIHRQFIMLWIVLQLPACPWNSHAFFRPHASQLKVCYSESFIEETISITLDFLSTSLHWLVLSTVHQEFTLWVFGNFWSLIFTSNANLSFWKQLNLNVSHWCQLMNFPIKYRRSPPNWSTGLQEQRVCFQQFSQSIHHRMEKTV